MTTNKKANFSRYNQPVPCRMCGKKTTWSEANGNSGLDLCRTCFDQATMDNEHYDGYHAETPKADCRLCKAEGVAKEAKAEEPVSPATDTDLSFLPNGGDDIDLRTALGLIKDHITSAETRQNRDLHKAIGLIVDVARRHGLLGGVR